MRGVELPAGEFRLHSIAILKTMLRNGRLHPCATICQCPDGARQLFQGDVFKPVALRAGTKSTDKDLVIVECCENQCRRQSSGLFQFPQNVQAVLLWKIHIEKDDVRLTVLKAPGIHGIEMRMPSSSRLAFHYRQVPRNLIASRNERATVCPEKPVSENSHWFGPAQPTHQS